MNNVEFSTNPKEEAKKSEERKKKNKQTHDKLQARAHSQVGRLSDFRCFLVDTSARTVEYQKDRDVVSKRLA